MNERMEISEFEYRLVESSMELIEATQKLVTNSLSVRLRFLIEPNDRQESSHLDEMEKEQLKRLNNLEGQLLTAEEASNAMMVDGKVPLWINVAVHRSRRGETIVGLQCSRRLRDESEMNAGVDKYPPFHPLIPLPPWHKETEQFNVNWKHQKLKRKWYAISANWKIDRQRRSHHNKA